jgi:hypothetical protein
MQPKRSPLTPLDKGGMKGIKKAFSVMMIEGEVIVGLEQRNFKRERLNLDRISFTL